MARDWSRYFADLRALARLLRYEVTEGSPEALLFEGCEKRLPRIGVVNASPKAIATVMIWRAITAPQDTTLVITSNKSIGRAHIELAESMLADGHDALHQAIWVLKDKTGLVAPSGGRPPVVACRPQVLDYQPLDDARQGHLLIVVPDIDSIPGCYLHNAALLSQKRNISVAFNSGTE